MGHRAFDTQKQLVFGLPARVLAVAAIFVVVELGLVATVAAGLQGLGALQAYTRGENSWSKAQKDALLHLQTYAETSQDSDYQAYLDDIGVTLGDHDAVTELQQPSPDIARARQGFIQGQNDPSDVDAMIWLFQTFHEAPRVQRALETWSTADLAIERLQHVALALRAGESRASFVSEIDSINAQVSRLEDDLATSMAETARFVQSLVLAGAVISISLLVGFSFLCLLFLAKRWNAADAAVSEKLRLSQERLRSVLDQAPIVLHAVDANGQITLAEGSALATLGFNREEMLGRCFFEILANAPATLARMRRALAGEVVHSQDRWNGRDFDSTLTPILDQTGSTVIGVSGVAIDITERLRAQSQLEEQASIVAEQAALLNLAYDGILVWELHSGAVRFWNHGAEVLYGWSSDEALGRTPQELLDTEFPRPLAEINAELVRTHRWEGELIHTARDGRRIVVASCWALQLDASGQPRAVVAINRDISERKKAEHALAHQARHDALTGLPNRTFMQESLANAIETLRSASTPFSLLLLDLDRFKDVNDSLGHPVGDDVLRRVGRRLQRTVRPTDVIARLGGDEFAVLLPGAQRSAAFEVARRLHETLSLPMEIEGTQLDLGVSVGFAIGPEHGQDPDVLMRRADAAMYFAKRGGTGIAVYDAEMETNTAERLRLTADLRHAIDHEELVLHYQPKIEADGKLVGVEALVRWQHPTRGLLGPDVFIPLAEQGGLIERLTSWVLQSARQQQLSWHAEGLDLTMAVNLSMRDVHDAQLAETLRGLLQDGQAGGFELELTESMLMADADRAQLQLNRFRALGVRVAVDDFGTGYSSLAYLKHLPVDDLKIDRCFVRDLARDQRDRALVKATVGMAHSLGLRVVAEGVEDAETLAILRAIGCDMMQGYHISRPLPAQELRAWAHSWLQPRASARPARAA